MFQKSSELYWANLANSEIKLDIAIFLQGQD